MDEYSKMMELFQNWLDVVADHASEDAYINGFPQLYEEFSDYAVTALEEIILPQFYDYYISEFNKSPEIDSGN